MSTAAVNTDRKATRTALAREARRLADEVEDLYIQLEQVGALREVLRYGISHPQEIPRVDLVQVARALRSYRSADLYDKDSNLVGSYRILSERPAK